MLQCFLVSSILKDYNKLMLHILPLSQQLQYEQNGFIPKTQSSPDARSKAGSPAQLHKFKTQHHYGSKTLLLDNKIEILDTEGPFTAKPITETNNSASSAYSVHHGKERSVK